MSTAKKEGQKGGGEQSATSQNSIYCEASGLRDWTHTLSLPAAVDPSDYADAARGERNLNDSHYRSTRLQNKDSYKFFPCDDWLS